MRIRSQWQRRFRSILAEFLECRFALSSDLSISVEQVDSKWFATGDVSLVPSEHSSRWIVQLNSLAITGGVADSAPHMNPPTVLPADEVLTSFQIVRGLGKPGLILVEANQNPDIAKRAIAENSTVDYFDFDEVISGAGDGAEEVLPHDPLFNKQSNLKKIDATHAWDITTGNSNIVVAVVDTGIDYNHPDLIQNIWTNPGEDGEKAGDGIDNDDNGFIDDVHGYDFVNDTGDPLDENGHGTHVAGTISAVGNNDQSVTGVAWNAQLMSLKFLNSNNSGTTSNAVRALNYATMMRQRFDADPLKGANIRVSNNSWGVGGGGIDAALQSAVEDQGKAGILFVAAAGNGNVLGQGVNNDFQPFYPASFDFDHVISVAATDTNDRLATFSNFGTNSVDIAAPGIGILSTERNGQTGYRNGTSMAAPQVSGVAALVFSRFSDATPQEVRNAILVGADQPSNLTNSGVSRRLNALGALTAETFAPHATLTTNISEISDETAIVVAVNIHFEDNVAVDATSLDAQNIAIRRAGYSNTDFSIALLTPNPQTGKSIDVVYTVLPTSGLWTAEHFGDYDIVLNSNQVRDTNGTYATEAVVGHFKVSITKLGVFHVTTTLDTVDANLGDNRALDSREKTSLRAAIQQGNALGPATSVVQIFLPDGQYSLTLAGANEELAALGDLDIRRPMMIIGNDTDKTIIDGGALDRVFDVQSVNLATNGNLILRRLTITNGAATGTGINPKDGSGGGILNQGLLELGQVAIRSNLATIKGGGLANAADATATINQTTIDGNRVSGTYGVGGGGIQNDGVLVLNDSTISRNVADGLALGNSSLNGGGGIRNLEKMRLINSTISGNTALRGDGGGILNYGDPTRQDAEMYFVTIAFNTALTGLGGGVRDESSLAMGGVLIAQNERQPLATGHIDYSADELTGSFRSRGGNLIVNANGAINRGGDIVLGRDLIGSLASNQVSQLTANGGLTETHELLAGSEAIDFISVENVEAFATDVGFLSANQLFDQAGRTRGGDGNVEIGDGVDVGALERFDTVIRGRLFQDDDSDGVLDFNEIGLPGWQVYVDLNNNFAWDSVEPITVTTADNPATASNDLGSYTLRSIPQGTHTIRAIPQSGFRASAPFQIPSDPTFELNPVVGREEFNPGLSSELRYAQIADGYVYFVQFENQQQTAYRISLETGELETLFQVGDQRTDGQSVLGIRDLVVAGGRMAFVDGTVRNHFQFVIREMDGRLVPLNPSVSDGLNVPAGNGDVTFSDSVLGFLDVEGNYRVALVPPTAGSEYVLDLMPVVFVTSAYVNSTILADVASGTIAAIEPLNTNPIAIGVVVSPLHYVDSPNLLISTLAPFEAFPELGIVVNLGSRLAIWDRKAYFSFQLDDGAWGLASGDSAQTTAPFLYGDEIATQTRDSVPTNLNILAVFEDAVLFTGFQGGTEILYLFSGGTTKRILGVGDELDGKTVTNFDIATMESLHIDRIAVRIDFAEGTQSIYSLQTADELVLGRTMTVYPGKEYDGPAFGVVPNRASLAGQLYEDQDRDRFHDPTEPALSGWRVYLDANSNNVFDEGEASKVTDIAGRYDFANLVPNRAYRIAFVPQNNYAQLSPTDNGGDWLITPSAGQDVLGLDFTFVAALSSGQSSNGTLRGVIFNDTNGDGIQNNGETAWNKTLLVYLDQNNDRIKQLAEVSLTTNDGTYLFAGLPSGTYNVRIEEVFGFSQSTPRGNKFADARIAVGDDPQGLVAVDFDGDTDLDLIVSNSNNNQLQLLQNNGGTYSKLPTTILTGNKPEYIGTADFDQKNGPDIVVSNYYSDTIAVYLNTGNTAVPYTTPTELPTEISSQTFGSGPRSVLATNVDPNLDPSKYVDLVTVNEKTDELVVFINDKTGNFPTTKRTSYLVGDAPVAVVAGEFDGNLGLDLATANFGSGTITIYRNNGNGGFVLQQTLTAAEGTFGIAAKDIDDDGIDDIVATNALAGNVIVYFGTARDANLPKDQRRANGSFTNRLLLSTGIGTNSVAIVDIDGDGDQDLAVTNSIDQNISILRNRGTRLFAAADSGGAAKFTGGAAFSVLAAQLDSDRAGTSDLALVNPNRQAGTGNANGEVVVFKNTIVAGSHRIAIDGTSQIVGLSFGLKPQNQPPTITPLMSPSNLQEDAAQQVISLTGITSGQGENQAVTIAVTSSDTSLIANAAAVLNTAGNGTLAYQPIANRFGSATLTITVHDVGFDVNDSSDDLETSITLVVNVAFVNDPPTILGDSYTYIRGMSASYLLNVLSNDSIAPDTGETLTLLLSDRPPTDAGTLVVENNQLRFTPVAAYVGNFSVEYFVSDGVNIVHNTLNIDVVRENVAPTAITLVGNTISVQDPIGSAVGVFSSSDLNPGDTFTYTLIPGFGDNALFTIPVGTNGLRIAGPLTAGNKSIRVRTTDRGGLFFEQSFTIAATTAGTSFPWHNSNRPSDTDEDGDVEIDDILNAIFYFNYFSGVGGALPAIPPSNLVFRRVDADPDNLIIVLDILRVVFDYNLTHANGEAREVDLGVEEQASVLIDPLYLAINTPRNQDSSNAVDSL